MRAVEALLNRDFAPRFGQKLPLRFGRGIDMPGGFTESIPASQTPPLMIDEPFEEMLPFQESIPLEHYRPFRETFPITPPQAMTEGIPIEWPEAQTDRLSGKPSKKGWEALSGKFTPLKYKTAEESAGRWEYGAEPAAAIPGEPIAFFGAKGGKFETSKAQIIYDEDVADNQPLGYKIQLQNGDILPNPKSRKIGGSPYFETMEEAQDYAESQLRSAKAQGENYRYHTTSVKNIENIKKQGLKPSTGQYGKGVYFAPTIEQTGGYGSPEGLMIRIKKTDIPSGYQEFTEQGWINTNIKSDKLEFSKDGGKTWFDKNGIR